MTYRKATIRPYRPDDESLLFGLARESFGTRTEWSDAETLTALETDTVFVAELAREPAGYVALRRQADAFCVEQLLVSSRHEGEGIGRQLLDYAEGYAISEGAVSLRIVVEEDNTRARDLYRRRGFAPVEEDVLELILPAD